MMLIRWRDHFGNEVADALEATIPPPYGTLGADKGERNDEQA